jgi:Ca2+-binding RTX toxin-like protein
MGAGGQLNFANLLKGKDASYSSSMIKVTYKNGERDVFKGSFSANPGTKTISGTGKEWIHTKSGALQFQTTGAKISASAVIAAAKTKTLSDDAAVVRKIFSGNDLIIGSTFADRLFGYDGNDTIQGRGGDDTIDGGKGIDVVSFAASTQPLELVLNGATPTVVIGGGVPTDTIVNIEGAIGGTGNDTFTGDGLTNLFLGGDGNDTIDGGAGNDTLKGEGGNDSLTGGAGKDTVLGGVGDDVLNGGSSADSLDGGAGSDTINGGGGKDTMDGGAGNDTLIGGAGKDSMTGGADADTFTFLAIGDSPATATGRDVITDFKHAVDKFDLSAIDASATLAGDDAFVLDAKGKANTAVAEGHIGWYQVNAAGTANDHTYLRINTDADAALEMTIELKGVVKLGLIDFIL